MVRTLFLQSSVLSALASMAVAQNMSDSMSTMNTTDSMGATDSMAANASAVPMDNIDYSGASGNAAHPGMTPGVLSPDGKCWCNAPPAMPAMPTGNMPSGVPPAMPMTPMPAANTTMPPATGMPPTVPATTPNTTVDDTTTSGVAFLKGSSNACLLAAAAVVGITSLAA